MGLPMQEYWSRLPFPSPGESSRPRDGTRLLHLLHWHVDSLPLSHLGSPHILYSSLKLMAEKHSPSYNHCAKPHSIRDVWEETHTELMLSSVEI